MSELIWDEASKRLYETGVDKVALFPMNSSNPANPYPIGYAWNGVTGVTESPEGADANDIYADNMKYLSLISVENWKGTIKAYTWPSEFNPCQGEYEYNDGSTRGIFFGQQTHAKFGLAWRTIVGNATEGDAYGYKLHVAYGLSAAPSEKDHATVNDSPEATEYSWELNSIPEAFKTTVDPENPNVKLAPVAHIVVDSRDNATAYAKLEKILFGVDEDETTGTDEVIPSLPLPDDLITAIS